MAMDHGHALERPAPLGLLDVACDLRLGHVGIVLERHGHELGAGFVAAADAGEGDDRAHVGAPARERCRLARGVERLALQTDGHALRSEVLFAPKYSWLRSSL